MKFKLSNMIKYKQDTLEINAYKNTIPFPNFPRPLGMSENGNSKIFLNYNSIVGEGGLNPRKLHWKLKGFYYYYPTNWAN